MNRINFIDVDTGGLVDEWIYSAECGIMLPAVGDIIKLYGQTYKAVQRRFVCDNGMICEILIKK